MKLSLQMIDYDSSDEEEVLQSIEKKDLKDLKTHNISVNSYRENGSTYFTWAIKKGDLPTLTYFLQKGAHINLREKGGATPLLLAVHMGRFEMVECLVRCGADVNMGDSYDTPLTAAVRHNFWEIAEFLIDNDADFRACDFKGDSPIFIAIKQNNMDVLEKLLKKKVVCDVVDSEGNTPLIAAIRGENKDKMQMIECLIRNGVDLNESKNEGTPLTWATKLGHMTLVRTLLKNGAKINLANSDGYTALSVAINCRRNAIANYLVENNANVCKSGKFGITPLSSAVISDDIPMIYCLLDHGANYVIDNAFITSIRLEKLNVVKLLHEKGAIINSTASITPLEVSLDQKNFDIAKYLIENGANVVHSLHEKESDWIIKFLEKNNIAMVKLLTKNGSRLDEISSSGHTPLTKAIEMENFEMTKYFLTEGASFDKANGNGLTPLAVAASNDDFKIFQFLVDCGATVSEKEPKNTKLARYYQLTKKKSLEREKMQTRYVIKSQK